MRRRTPLLLVTVLWLSSQIAVLGFAPFAACCEGALAGGPACCEGMAPGDMCPMHRAGTSTSDSDVPAMQCVCRVSNAALAATVLLGHGLLPPVFVLPYAPVAGALNITDIAAQTLPAPAETPPPRA
jgi:hypothetical protein